MREPHIAAWALGQERQPLVIIEDFAPAPEALRAAALDARFEPAGRFYPGIRADLPESYMQEQLPIIARALAKVGRHGPVQVLGAAFSIVTTRPEALSVPQRLPHCDAFTPDRIALVHYLSPEGGDGTAFYRHRSTGFEVIDEHRKAGYMERVAAEVQQGTLPHSYMTAEMPLFEQIAHAEGRYNRALLYPSFLLHSGAIAPDAALSPDPAIGRLTVTAFLSLG
jgi:hypothetical protein